MKLKCIRCEIIDNMYYVGFQSNNPVMYFNIQLELVNGKTQKEYINDALEQLKPSIMEKMNLYNNEPVIGQVFSI